MIRTEKACIAQSWNEDIAVLETVEKLEAVNGMSRDKRRALEQLQENIKNRPDYLVWREEGLK